MGSGSSFATQHQPAAENAETSQAHALANEPVAKATDVSTRLQALAAARPDLSEADIARIAEIVTTPDFFVPSQQELLLPEGNQIAGCALYFCQLPAATEAVYRSAQTGRFEVVYPGDYTPEVAQRVFGMSEQDAWAWDQKDRANTEQAQRNAATILNAFGRLPIPAEVQQILDETSADNRLLRWAVLNQLADRLLRHPKAPYADLYAAAGWCDTAARFREAEL